MTGRDVPQVHPRPRRVRGRRPQHAVGEQAGVQPGDLVSGGREHRGHHGAQIALVSGEQYAQGFNPQVDSEFGDGERLGVARVAFDAPDPGEPQEGLPVVPGPVPLRGVVLLQQPHLVLGGLRGQRLVHHRTAQVPVPLDDLVAQYEMVAERGRHQLRQAAVVLVRVLGARGEHQVGLGAGAQLLDRGLRLRPVRGQPAVGHLVHGQPEVGARAERGERLLLLLLALRAAARQHQRVDPEARMGPAQGQQGAAGADGDVVAVRAHRDDPLQTSCSQPDHALTPVPVRSHTAHGRSPGRRPRPAPCAP